MNMHWFIVAWIQLITLVDISSAGTCVDYCKYTGICTLDASDNPSCNCTIGFDKARCKHSALVTQNKKLTALETAGTKLTVTEAYMYSYDTYLMFTEHFDLQYDDIADSVEQTVMIIDRLLIDIAYQLNRNSDIQLQNITEVIIDLSTLIHRGLNMTACTIYDEENCTIPRQRANELFDKTDENLVSMVTLLLNTDSYETLSDPTLLNDNIVQRVSISAIKSKGKDLPPGYEADFGNLTLPYWETFQDTVKNKKVIMNVMTYKESPYKSVFNPESVNSSIVRTIAKDKNAKNIRLKDPDDPIFVEVDVSKVINNKASLLPMDIIVIEEADVSKCLVSMNESVQAIMTEILIDMDPGAPRECTILGKYGTSGYPTSLDYDLQLIIKGPNKVMMSEPTEMIFSYKDRSLIFTIINQGFTQDLPIDPLSLTLSCKGENLAGKVESDHTCRTGELKVSYLDPATYNWARTDLVKINKQGSKTLKFESQFFGTFAASSLFLPPTPIDFESIFLNFFDRIQETPQVLAVNVILIILFVSLAIPLRRADKGDRLLWMYLPLIDNSSDACYIYFISVYTAIRSPRNMTATAFCRLLGEKGGSEIHVLLDGQRTNFKRGTCSNFKLATKMDLGKLQRIKIWHNNNGDSPRWLLNKVVITEEATGDTYVFLCGKWLSLDCEDGQNWRTLYPISKETLNGDTLFTENSHKRFFDDNLWLSISKRPFHSRFTRVQRLWSLLALLFLSMLTSAMWFSQEKEQPVDVENPYQMSVSLGPFKFNAKQIYVGLMSAVIAFLPSVVIVSVFRNRRFKGEGKIKGKDDPEYIIQKSKIETPSRRKCLLPWWTIFFAYGLVIICIVCCGFFTFLYSLEFGKDKTNDWLLSFCIGTIQSIILLEPVKVGVLAIIFACFLKGIAGKELQDNPNPEIFDSHNTEPTPAQTESDTTNEDSVSNGAIVEYCPCPDSKGASSELRKLRRRLQLDRQLASYFRDGLWKLLYVAMIALICSHNIVTVSYRQNDQLSTSINKTFVVNTTDDIYLWLTDFLIPAVLPKWLNDGEVLRTAYEQKFMYNGYNYRLGLIRLRQVRTAGNCGIVDPMQKALSICKYEYSSGYESQESYCKGWQPYNTSCFDDTSLLDTAFLFKDDKYTKALPYFGTHAIYKGGGYTFEIGPKQSLAITQVNDLKNNVWIDIDTRAIFVDSVSFNANTRLFSHLKVVFEMTPYGLYAMTVKAWSSNLYPYVSTWDYFVLLFQVLFIAIVFVRTILYFVEVYKTRTNCYRMLAMWIRPIELVLSIAAIAFYVVRIHQTIKAIEEIRNDPGKYVSFEMVQLFDNLYQWCLAGTLFIVSLDLLKPLKMNYHLFVLHSSLVKARLMLFSFTIILLVLIFAFASYLMLTAGSTVAVFRDLPTSMLTLFRFLLLMVSLGNFPQLESTEAHIAVAMFALIVSISAVNIFVTILTFYFAEISELQSGNKKGEFVFNQELNSHLWWRIDSAIKAALGCLEVRKVNKARIEPSEDIFPHEKLDQISDFVKTTAKEDVEFHRLVLQAAVWCEKRRQEGRILLECAVVQSKFQTFYRNTLGTILSRCWGYLVDNTFVVVAEKVFQQIFGIPIGTNRTPLLADIVLYSYEAEVIQSLLSNGNKQLASRFNFTYRFLDPMSGCTRIVLVIPDLCCTGLLDIKCYHILNLTYADKYISKHKTKFKSSVFEFEPNGHNIHKGYFRLQLHDIEQSDERCIKLLNNTGELWEEVPMTEMDERQTFECGMKTIPQFIVALDGGNKTTELDMIPKDGIETHSISSDGGIIRMKCDKSVALTFEPRSVQGPCELLLQKQTVCDTPILHITASTDVSKPIKIQLPDRREKKHNPSEDRQEELIVALKEGGSQWSFANTVLARVNDEFSFKVKNVQIGSTATVFVKPSEMGWVRFPLDAEDSRTLKAINYISRYEMIAQRWKEIAAILCVDIPPRFLNTSAYIEAKEVEDNKNGKQFIELPLTCQEKCFYVLHTSYSNEENFNLNSLKDLMLEIGYPLVSEGLSKLF